MIAGLASAAVLFGYAWWAPLLLAAGLAVAPTGCCARAGSGRTAAPTRCRPPSRTPSTPTGWPSTLRRPRRCGCSAWPTGCSTGSSAAGSGCTSCSTRRPGCGSGRSWPVRSSCWSPTGWSSGRWPTSALGGRIGLGALVAFAQAALGSARIAFGGLNWALDGASAPVAAVLRLGPRDRAGRRAAGGDAPGRRAAGPRDPVPRVSFSYPGTDAPVLRDFDLTIPAGTSLAIVGRNGAGKTTLAKLLCRLYDPRLRLDRGGRGRPARVRPRARGGPG